MRLDEEIHIRIDEETKKQLIAKAKAERRTLSNYILSKLDKVLKNVQHKNA